MHTVLDVKSSNAPRPGHECQYVCACFPSFLSSHPPLQTGVVYVVEFSPCSDCDLRNSGYSPPTFRSHARALALPLPLAPFSPSPLPPSLPPLQTGVVYAVEFSHRSGRDLVNMAKKRTNVIPIIEDARHPQRYRMLVGMVDTIFADVAQPDQVIHDASAREIN